MFAVLTIIMMILDQRTNTLNQMRVVLTAPLTSLQYLVSWPINLIDNVSQLMSSRQALLNENLDLKAQQLLLKAQMQRLVALESENNQLKTLLRSSAQIQGKMVIAQLLAVDSDPFIRQVILDKGSHDNVSIGLPVLDANGVMGQIIQVSPATSRVMLINDPQSGIPVQDTRNNIRAIAVGDSYSNQLRLVNISHTTDIRIGDLFVTSGLGQNYPEGYPVGEVVSVVHDLGLAFADIKLQSKARLDQSRQVLVVWPNKSASEIKEHKNA